MDNVLARHWWALALRGVLGIVVGVIAFLQPGVANLALVWLFGAYALVDGVFALAAIFSRQGGAAPWWALLLEGVVGIGAGLASFVAPGAVLGVLVLFIAFWAIVTGVLEIVAAVRLRNYIQNEWWMVLGGVLSVLLGILILAWPLAGALYLAWSVGAYALVSGVVLLVLAFRLRDWGRRARLMGGAL
jgi:uncharacterized membrane protein HdeD (DUF308 family)